MSLTVNALLVDPQGQPLANLDAQVYQFTLAGTAKLIGSGRSGTDGRLSILCAFTPAATADYQPRLQLRLKRGTVFVEASENPQSANATVYDLGKVTFNPTAPVNITYQAVMVNPADIDTLREQVSSLSQTKSALEQQLSGVTAEKATALANLQNAQAQLQTKDALIAQKDKAVAEAEARLDAQQKAEVPVVSLGLLAQSTADQLKNTQASLRQDRSGFQLGRVTVQLKVMTGQDGGQVGLPRAKDIERVGAAALSQVQLEFNPTEPKSSNSDSQPAQTRVPRLTGYTELVARRKLAEAKLTAEVLNQWVVSEDQANRVITQTPAPGVDVAEDSVVTIAIGKKG